MVLQLPPRVLPGFFFVTFWYRSKALAQPIIAAWLEKAMTFSVPISFFKSISIIFGGAGLIFEGLINRVGCRNDTFCQGLPGVPACHASFSAAKAAAKRVEQA
jgi:hypothetical protein